MPLWLCVMRGAKERHFASDKETTHEPHGLFLIIRRD